MECVDHYTGGPSDAHVWHSNNDAALVEDARWVVSDLDFSAQTDLAFAPDGLDQDRYCDRLFAEILRQWNQAVTDLRQ